MNPEDKIEILTEAMQQILNWCMAYPVSAFPAPDLVRARQLLEAGGITLDAVSADAMRHCLEGVGSIAMAAMESVKE